MWQSRLPTESRTNGYRANNENYRWTRRQVYGINRIDADVCDKKCMMNDLCGMKHTLTRTPNKSENECKRGHQQELPEFCDEIAARANGSGDEDWPDKWAFCADTTFISKLDARNRRRGLWDGCYRTPASPKYSRHTWPSRLNLRQRASQCLHIHYR